MDSIPNHLQKSSRILSPAFLLYIYISEELSMKYFVVSDIHSFYTTLKQALYRAGFRKTKKDHVLIVCGDVFDRGEETMQVYHFLKSLPKNRCILIKGNHESLFDELLKKNAPDDYDFSNGTVKTFCSIAGVDEEVLSRSYYYKNNLGDGYYDRIRRAWIEIKSAVKNSPVYEWLHSDQWKDYYELDEFIFVHSFIPVKVLDDLPAYYINSRQFEYFADWRTDATADEWYTARWGCPWLQYKNGLFDEEKKNGKKLVVGHWHCGDFWTKLSHVWDTIDDIYYDGTIIAIDGGVHAEYLGGPHAKRILVHHQNVLVIDESDDSLKDQYGFCLVPPKEPYAKIETVSVSD